MDDLLLTKQTLIGRLIEAYLNRVHYAVDALDLRCVFMNTPDSMNDGSVYLTLRPKKYIFIFIFIILTSSKRRQMYGSDC